ncbi:hypothetical protein ACRRTK_020973 [Alexandromys fortis]
MLWNLLFNDYFKSEIGNKIFILQNTVSLCSPVCPGTCFVDQADLKLTEIHLPLPPECWD